MIGGPEPLLLDEPTTGFDPAARRQFWELIRSLADEGTTILLTTHYLAEAEEPADRLAVVARGRVVAEGTAAALRYRFGSDAVVEWTEADGRPRRESTGTGGGAGLDGADALGGGPPGRPAPRARPERPGRSDRETAVLRLVAEGCTNAEIGRRLFIGESTVETHLLRIFGKLGVADRTAAVTSAMRHGLPSP